MNLFLDALATVVLSGPFDQKAICARIRKSLVVRSDAPLEVKLTTRWVTPLVKAFLSAVPARPRHRQVVSFLSTQQLSAQAEYFSIETSRCSPPLFLPLKPQFAEWGLPQWRTTGQLADFLGISPVRLDWLCGRYPVRDSQEIRQRYQIRWQRSRTGKLRMIEIPCPQLMRIQRQLLHDVLDRIPVHAAAHGFRAKHSTLTCVSPHVAQAVVWKLDLASFFLSIPRCRVTGLFRMLGYPEAVAEDLGWLTTNAVPSKVLQRMKAKIGTDQFQELERFAAAGHLPQGAPSSPALANLIAYRLDCRLNGLATAYGAHYSRYADDLLFSGDYRFKRYLAGFRIQVLAIILDEGFLIRRRKSKVMVHSRRQQALGIVINQHPNLPRQEYKLLHAILHNCVVQGPHSQNRDGHLDYHAHLAGRIANLRRLNPARAAKLQTMFEQINWQRFDS
ncbi:reverse transcriptase family protein [Planctomicrobium piriforme]|uniref:RNA-directed DNA polymerase n=1 Tax=Planctomicrobium piriforme TaxID=1576369 RepID=A0A1I3ASZ8_9PLAN|nr:reverse transcriptase family protein [Planctomicrobium piriforme]SFH53090.1 Reverse transcriptase (RNA-dependent DNA polymerase) [Planctomicrobium piriforme]